MISPSSPITGGAQTGFTSPTYTFVSYQAPTINGKQIAITATGGTQTGVTTHTASSPFTINYVTPANPATAPAVNPSTGIFRSKPRVNRHKVIVRKGMTPAVNQAVEVGSLVVDMGIPAGCETYDPANVRGMISAAIGYLNQLSAGIGDTAVSNIS